MQKSEIQRKLHIDLLRIVSCFSVILLHSAAQYWYELPVTSTRWLVSNAYDAVSRFGVPAFVMISGMLFLSREGSVDLKRLYRNNILRMLTAYWAWSAVYGIWDCREWMGAPGVTWKDYVSEIVFGRYHLWFIPMIIGIYILLPVIKIFTDHADQNLLKYVLLVFLVLQVGVNTVIIVNPPQVAQTVIQMLNVQLINSYVPYFILGYYLYRYPVAARYEKWIYGLGVVGAILAVVVSSWASIRNGGPSAAAFDSFSLFTFLVTVAVFVFFQQRISGLEWGSAGSRLIRELSANTFGVYLLHLLVIEYLAIKGFDSMTVDSVVGIPLLALVCYILCNVVVAVLRRIPLIGRYLC